MEFVITKFSHYLPFKNDDNKIEGIRREYIGVEGFFLGSVETPNRTTRDLISNIKVNVANTMNKFNFYIGSEDEFKSLRVDENSQYINTVINLKATEKTQSIDGAVYLSRQSFDELKALISIIPNSNSYFRFETIVYGDKVKNLLPIEIELHSQTCGVEMTFPIQQPSTKPN